MGSGVLWFSNNRLYVGGDLYFIFRKKNRKLLKESVYKNKYLE